MTIANRPESILVLPSNVLEGPYRIDQATWAVCYNDTNIVHNTHDSKLPGSWAILSDRQARQLSAGHPVVVHFAAFPALPETNIPKRSRHLALRSWPGDVETLR